MNSLKEKNVSSRIDNIHTILDTGSIAVTVASTLDVSEQDTNFAGAMNAISNSSALVSATAPTKLLAVGAVDDITGDLENLECDTNRHLKVSVENSNFDTMITDVTGAISTDIGGGGIYSMRQVMVDSGGSAMGYQHGAGNNTTGVQRVTIATDDVNLASLNTGITEIATAVNSAEMDNNIVSLNGTAIAVNSGVLSAGVQRVTLATDDLNTARINKNSQNADCWHNSGMYLVGKYSWEEQFDSSIWEATSVYTYTQDTEGVLQITKATTGSDIEHFLEAHSVFGRLSYKFSFRIVFASSGSTNDWDVGFRDNSNHNFMFQTDLAGTVTTFSSGWGNVAQSAWIDPLDGTGDSGLTYDVTDWNTYEIELTPYGCDAYIWVGNRDRVHIVNQSVSLDNQTVNRVQGRNFRPHYKHCSSSNNGEELWLGSLEFRSDVSPINKFAVGLNRSYMSSADPATTEEIISANALLAINSVNALSLLYVRSISVYNDHSTGVEVSIHPRSIITATSANWGATVSAVNFKHTITAVGTLGSKVFSVLVAPDESREIDLRYLNLQAINISSGNDILVKATPVAGSGSGSTYITLNVCEFV